MNPQEFQALVEAGRESFSLEFKQSETWDNLKHVITRCVLAMSNTRDGGRLVIGIDNSGNLLGVTPDHLATFDEEAIKDHIANFADPYVDFDMDQVSLDGNEYLVFSIREFSDIPVICKRGFQDRLRQGAVYVRTRNRRPQSAEVTDAIHMRELVDLAIDKGTRALQARGWQRAQVPGAAAQFEAELNDINL